MSVELIANCDECRASLGDGGFVVCEACWENIKEEHEREIELLRKSINRLEDKLYRIREK